ncbi:MAG: SHOCT domain-containing protein [Epibacterium sp.]|nr:SHOCT domain-containing protein [Epibacterium sp.]NQX72417.1 SHOCT domain-containing protein [Epibacterium sp.]
MTAMLQEMRRLEVARSRGEITPAQYNDIRRRLLNAVEEVEVVDGQGRATRGASGAPGARQRQAAMARPGAGQAQARAAHVAGPRMNIWGLVVLLSGLATLATLFLGAMLGDFTIALTVAVTVCAALLVASAKTIFAQDAAQAAALEKRAHALREAQAKAAKSAEAAEAA